MLGPAAVVLIFILHSRALYVTAFSSDFTSGHKEVAKRCVMLKVEGPVQHFEKYDNANTLLSRRLMLIATASTTTMMISSDVCNAAEPPKKIIDPETAYSNLRKAREELVFAGRTYFPKLDWEGLREYLDKEDSYLNNYDANAGALLTSKRLDTESKRAIGTIRRYGVGADVIIMYGGLKSELLEERPNSSEIQKYYIRALDSLEEVISIVRSNPGFSK
eukprot:CAMPEP_0194150890 /NCGR_PEP_ID=MMETSP0152-20130528/45608_1 /TAXON_ID=1049557 /ORGANISM="Thalassiothrix antarctica, Strain L6-D1" /LENGTH=218 /DNA_ID=CAMNT_0038854219 /DNA_START=45 /DNA_END=698 /DNA_ORIENTATION=+